MEISLAVPCPTVIRSFEKIYPHRLNPRNTPFCCLWWGRQLRVFPGYYVKKKIRATFAGRRQRASMLL